MDNLKTLKFDGSESYSDCTHNIHNSEVVFSITKQDGFYEVIVKAHKLGMCNQFFTIKCCFVYFYMHNSMYRRYI